MHWIASCDEGREGEEEEEDVRGKGGERWRRRDDHRVCVRVGVCAAVGLERLEEGRQACVFVCICV